MGAGPTWTAEDKQLIRDNMDLPDKVLAEKLGRTRIAVTNIKSRLRHNVSHRERHQREGKTFDTRESGWYEETIGLLLIQDPDAFATWKHYHRYVEVIYDGEIRERITMWITLQCRRDADAP